MKFLTECGEFAAAALRDGRATMQTPAGGNGAASAAKANVQAGGPKAN